DKLESNGVTKGEIYRLEVNQYMIKLTPIDLKLESLQERHWDKPNEYVSKKDKKVFNIIRFTDLKNEPVFKYYIDGEEGDNLFTQDIANMYYSYKGSHYDKVQLHALYDYNIPDYVVELEIPGNCSITEFEKIIKSRTKYFK
ncbi:hypothetical protein V6O07_03340, partial [Arthrospira platensis SPKY2]